jgi:MoaA/NifB/PqqE/SkfB family radical SAM enzyme
MLLDGARARALKQAGVSGIGLSLDSLNPETHDAFRARKGAWLKAMAAIDICRAEHFPFQIHFSVTDDTAHEIDDMIAFARNAGALVLNVFFLVCTGRGEKYTDISADNYDSVLRRVTQAAHDEKRLMVRAKCAPHFKRMALAIDERGRRLVADRAHAVAFQVVTNLLLIDLSQEYAMALTRNGRGRR